MCRAGVVALVCKSWNKVERESPHQPTRIHVGWEQPDKRAALMWHLRDTSKLLKVALHGDIDWVPNQYRARDMMRKEAGAMWGLKANGIQWVETVLIEQPVQAE
jgi:hypothetical protein